MAPLSHLIQRAFNAGLPSNEFSEQWKHSSDVFSVLLILGGDVVARALAQLSGSRFTPVAFSFGWVAYAITAVVSVIGKNKLMPSADFPCTVINGKTGSHRNNNSWIIGRMVRDFETWMDKQPRAGGLPPLPMNPCPKPVHACVERVIEAQWRVLKQRTQGRDLPEPERPLRAGLCVSVYKAQKATKGYPGYDAPYIAGFLISLAQLGVAAIPCVIFGDWGILLITAAGIVLSFISGSLPQWSQEKWACRTDTEKTVVLTSGNGSQHAIVIQGAGVGLDLEDLSAADTIAFASLRTRLVVIALAFLWILLLITASGIKQNTWFLLAVGGIGIGQNMYVAGTRRSPGAFGVPLEFVEVIGRRKAMDTLFAVERSYPRLGKSMLPIYFPGELREEEKQRWARYGGSPGREGTK